MSSYSPCPGAERSVRRGSGKPGVWLSVIAGWVISVAGRYATCTLILLMSLMCDMIRPHRGTVSDLIRASVKVHRSVVAVTVDSKSSASSVRNLMTKWTCCTSPSFVRGEGEVQVSASARNYCVADGIRLI